jgi:glycyl-tRNA synthetase beta chain
MADFLFELGTEEIPAPMIPGLFEELADRVRKGLTEAGLAFDEVLSFGAPRRIGFLAKGLPLRQADRTESVVGPALSIARDAQGNWTKAAEGFARKQGVDMSVVKEVTGPKGPCVGFEREVKGRATGDILAEIVPAAVEGLYLPKAMRWGDWSQLFVRPVRWAVALLEDQIVPISVTGVASGRTTRGHRFHGASSVDIPSASSYFEVMRKQFVLADPAERRQRIKIQLRECAAEVAGSPHEDPELLETVAYLCEYPTVLSGDIPKAFLSLPSEILVTCLREHQKFFVVMGQDGEPMPCFLSVIDAPDDPKGFIRRGNQNVSVSRLSDAQFFFEHDKAVPLDQRLEELRGIVFHPKLGSYHDKALRMEDYARRLAESWGADPQEAVWAAGRSKCDLASLLVQEKEFTALQGIAGGLYAKAQGRSDAEADAIYDHYLPASLESALPRGTVGACVAAADKVDTLVEMFRIGQAPTGSKDPFALRRAALGLLRILVEKGLKIDLPALLSSRGVAPDSLTDFLSGRLRYLWEERGFAYDEINAVLAFGLTDPSDLDMKLRALHLIRSEFGEDFDHLSVAFKRVRNILKGIDEYPLDPGLFLPASEREGAGERALFAAYESVKDKAGELIDRGQYAEALRVLATVRPAVDKFFDDVLVMCDPEGKDPHRTALQRNRLALLQRMVALFNRVADFSEIVPKENS